MVGLGYDPPVFLLHGLDQVRKHGRRKAQVVLGRLQAFMPHVDGEEGKSCREIPSFTNPPVQNADGIGVA